MAGRLKRDVGPWALMFTGLGSIIGSGWLFGAARAANLAGPGAIFAWLLGMGIVLLFALLGTELGTMMPESGGMVRYARYSHGSLLGFLTAWANWISIVSVIPIEAEASVQYMSSWPYPWAQHLMVNGELTGFALMLSAGLVIIYFLLNYWGVKLFARANSAITVFKIIIPAATAVALMASSFHAPNVSGAGSGGMLPYGLAGVLTAIATSGIVFAFNGFQSPLNLAGEARNPSRSVPFAVVGSVLLSGAIYVLLQVAYLGVVDPAQIVNGWAHVTFDSPFAQLALALNLNWLAMLLYLDAFVSPSGTGTTYMASTTRMLHGMQRNGTAPDALGVVHPVYGIPRGALWCNLGVSFIFLYFFRGWGSLAAAISVATIISYVMIPICAMSLRRTARDMNRPVRLPGIYVIGHFAFMCASLLLYWARWPLTGYIILLLIAALPIYIYYQSKKGWVGAGDDVRAARWFVLYLLVMAALSWAGSAAFGGHDYLPYGWDMVIVSVISLVFSNWGVRSGWRTDALEIAEQEHAAK
ncbi:Amino acid permease [Granulibacter bethesdensis]|uniref:Amino acid permease n=1 Tax=Granulibacter bethesdensis TaxID=364410 RepID=A0AAC9K8S0_9PROT|nr:APC family permease [Granulibacter bethesdensis]APH55495.1 Amino acid permease [Granulibacter bethesdensis]APH63081.1 Amino acid permease [Granulibacter bethesdensis]